MQRQESLEGTKVQNRKSIRDKVLRNEAGCGALMTAQVGKQPTYQNSYQTEFERGQPRERQRGKSIPCYCPQKTSKRSRIELPLQDCATQQTGQDHVTHMIKFLKLGILYR